MGLIRETRQQLGLPMRVLAERLGVGVQTVSRMELNDDRGAIKVGTRERALRALGKRTITVLVDSDVDTERVRAIEREVRKEVAAVAWTMALEAQNLTEAAIEDLVREFVRKKLAAL